MKRFEVRVEGVLSPEREGKAVSIVRTTDDIFKASGCAGSCYLGGTECGKKAARSSATSAECVCIFIRLFRQGPLCLRFANFKIPFDS